MSATPPIGARATVALFASVLTLPQSGRRPQHRSLHIDDALGLSRCDWSR
jgi:hypothetical protein